MAAAPDLLALILAAEGLLVLGLLAFNAYFLTQKPVLHYIREIYFINGRRFRQAWYLVISATTFFFLVYATILVGHLGFAVSPERADAASTIFTLCFGTLIILAFGLVFSVFIKYVRGLPASSAHVHDLIVEDMRKALLRDDVDARVGLEYESVGDVVTQRRQLGPHVSLAHYRAVTAGFAAYMEKRWGHMGDTILYAVGRLAGRRAAVEVRKEAPDAEAALRQLVAEIRDHGIGIAEVRNATGDRVDIVLHESAPAAGSRPQGRPLCHYPCGMFAGIYETLDGRPTLARETHCWGLGDQYCEFRVEFQGARPTSPRP